MIHPTAEVQTSNIGADTHVWQFSVILKGAVIGNACNINCHTFIENDVIVGDRVTVKSGVYLWDGLRVEDDVFIGPNVSFTNDNTPRSRVTSETYKAATLKRGCSIDANSTIIGAITIGDFALVGAGAVVTKDIPPYALVYGNPAKIVGEVNKEGHIVKKVTI